MYIQVISDYKCRGQLGQISGKCTLGYYDTLAFSLRKSESAMWCMLTAARLRRQEGSSRLSMASSVYESGTLYSNKCKLQHPVSIQEPA